MFCLPPRLRPNVDYTNVSASLGGLLVLRPRNRVSASLRYFGLSVSAQAAGSPGGGTETGLVKLGRVFKIAENFSMGGGMCSMG